MCLQAFRRIADQPIHSVPSYEDTVSEGIATSTTRTVVYSSLCVLGFDFVLTAVMFGGV